MSDHKAPCASGTWFTDGRQIAEAIRQQHRSALAAYPREVRRNRTPLEWHALYQQAMEEKRKNGSGSC